MTCEPAPWREIEERLRPFVARRVAGPDVDDVLQDVYVRMQRGLANLRDDDSFTAWLFQIARSAIAEQGRARARHPIAEGEAADDAAPEADDDDREAARNLSGCVADFVARLPSPYREAVTLVELDGITVREAAEVAGISVSGMKSRVQRGRAQLRALFEECCAIAVDARNKVVDYAPHDRCGC
ncbi:MAG: sigma-70 family RNA polymerase sigma factor [Kofleriaceae bacterium]|nr:MAG: sigma-70 family RNA polymerase sigma factor [Kofleriaceae bacterium]MBZ0231048.1 sigma-70 family RNA polymerase sigma factor [Kofleriaceae bacterium]